MSCFFTSRSVARRLLMIVMLVVLTACLMPSSTSFATGTPDPWPTICEYAGPNQCPPSLPRPPAPGCVITQEPIVVVDENGIPDPTMQAELGTGAYAAVTTCAASIAPPPPNNRTPNPPVEYSYAPPYAAANGAKTYRLDSTYLGCGFGQWVYGSGYVSQAGTGVVSFNWHNRNGQRSEGNINWRCQDPDGCFVYAGTGSNVNVAFDAIALWSSTYMYGWISGDCYSNN